MNLLMVSGDRSVLQGKKGAFHYTLEEFAKHWGRIDILSPRVAEANAETRHPFPNVHFHPSPGRLWRQPRWILRKGRELIHEYKHAVMTVHEYPPFYNGIGAEKLQERTRIPYALEIHHIIGYPKAASAAEWIGRLLSRRVLPIDAKKAKAVRVVNQGTKDTLARWGIPAEKIHVVPSFYLDTAVLKPDRSVTKQYDLAFCGRLVKNKGLLPLLNTLSTMEKVSLLVIGDGSERGRAEAFVQSHGLTERVTFLGWLPTQEDVIRAIQSAKVFIVNSLSEGGPRVALEAMACGMPVVATRVGVLPDVIRDGVNGFLTDGTSSDLQRRITSLLSDSSLPERIGKEAEHIIETFERSRLIAQYAEFIRSLAT
ncbi:MAG: glycosyltransferase family 4 protein [Candidatus Peregrinibacteria bacterium]|nr:glycosyltransferase family 4 protein [Candidatus Peregrinibacteria bacterium]